MDSQKSMKTCCTMCNKSFAKASNLKRHLANTHQLSDVEFLPKKQKTCPICGNDAGATYKQVLVHLATEHQIDVEIEKMTFESIEDFFKWKVKEETKTKSFYVKSGGNTNAKQGFATSYYYCHRSGYAKLRGTGKRSMKMLGSNKINSLCPSQMKLKTIDDGQVILEYVKSHIGHTFDVERMRLTDEEKMSIADKIAKNIPFASILDDVRSSGDNNRLHIINRRDLLNIAKEFGLNQCGMLNANDASSIGKWVTEVAGEESPVVFYKSENSVLEETSIFSKDDFLLIVMNPFQKELLKTYGNNMVCLDSVPGKKAFGFGLTTIMIIDGENKGFPVAFICSNRQDEMTMEFAFNKIKGSAVYVKVATLITGLDSAHFCAWVKVFGAPCNHLYCIWLVDQVWRNNLWLVSDREKRVEVYEMLRCILDETDETAFNSVLEAAMEFFHSNPETEEFGKYFVSQFSSNCRQWAACFRKWLGKDTTRSLETLHRNIKYHYLEGQREKRLDKTVRMLLKYVVSKHCREKKYLCDGKLSTKKIIQYRHLDSVKIGLENVKSGVEGWLVNSESTDGVVYHIERCAVQCSRPCPLSCSECNCCLHQFRCSCVDNAIRHNMCKHIHLVSRKIAVPDLKQAEMHVKVEHNYHVDVRQTLQLVCQELNTEVEECDNIEDQQVAIHLLRATLNRLKAAKRRKISHQFTTSFSEQRIQDALKQSQNNITVQSTAKHSVLKQNARKTLHPSQLN